MQQPRVIAVDWSGRAGSDQKKTIYLAEVSPVTGRLLRLENGRTRGEVVDLLIKEAKEDPNLIVGFDFAFSLPEWFLRRLGIVSVRDLWARMASESLTPKMKEVGLVEWLRTPEPPFWAATKAASGLQAGQEFRQSDLEFRQPGMQPKSVFQLVGAGQVGRGSLYGMQALHRLADAGFTIWPFDEPRFPLALEIFPRVFSIGLTKSDPKARRRFLTQLQMDGVDEAARSEDAFDATISANALNHALSTGELSSIRAEPQYALEGRIWGMPAEESSIPPTQSPKESSDSSNAQMRDHLTAPWGAQTQPRAESGRFAARSNKCTPRAERRSEVSPWGAQTRSSCKSAHPASRPS